MSVGNGRRSPISGSPARIAFMCLVNSVLSSSLMVWVTFAEEPCTWILPPMLPLETWRDVPAPPPGTAAGELGSRTGLLFAGVERSLEMSCYIAPLVTSTKIVLTRNVLLTST